MHFTPPPIFPAFALCYSSSPGWAAEICTGTEGLNFSDLNKGCYFAKSGTCVWNKVWGNIKDILFKEKWNEGIRAEICTLANLNDKVWSTWILGKMSSVPSRFCGLNMSPSRIPGQKRIFQRTHCAWDLQGMVRARECCPDDLTDATPAGMGQLFPEQFLPRMSWALFPCLLSPVLSCPSVFCHTMMPHEGPDSWSPLTLGFPNSNNVGNS